MIHEAMLLEYSARHLALMEWGAALKLFNLLAQLRQILINPDRAAQLQCVFQSSTLSQESPMSASSSPRQQLLLVDHILMVLQIMHILKQM